MLQMVEHAFRILYRRLEVVLPDCTTLLLGVDGWEQGSSSRAVLPLTRHQCSIYCESSRVDHGASKRRWAPQTTRDAPEFFVYLILVQFMYRCL